MDTNLFDYPLPKDAIAHEPLAQRDQSRLMYVNRATRTVSHHRFCDIEHLLPEKAQLFRNDARVFKARLEGVRDTGGRVECLLLTPAQDPRSWWALVRPGKKLPIGSRFGQAGLFEARVEAKNETGQACLYFDLMQHGSVVELAHACGSVPLPPYIEGQDAKSEQTYTRYNTVYSKKAKCVAAAAPTAGLHFTDALIDALRVRGVGFHDLTLHVGLGTFQPIQVDQVEAHDIHSEFYEIPVETQQALVTTSPGTRIAVGTTTLRAIESASSLMQSCIEAPIATHSDLFVYPPAFFQQTDGLITNFHLPKSSLLCLVSAFLTPGSTDGIAWLKELYQEALSLGYRFYSYGDAMLIL